MKTSKKTSQRAGYLHGYSSKEQQRLVEQARFLEPWVYGEVDLSSVHRLLEIGCGVGAQTEILLRRFPHLKIAGVDLSGAQLKAARKSLSREIRKERVSFHHEDATRLPFLDSSFDGAFLCWILEHVPEPVKVLKEALRVLRPGAKIVCTEVLNSSLFVEPYSPAIQHYWSDFNDQQWNMKGDPFVGAKLGNLLLEAGFQKVETRLLTFHFDSRTPKLRAEFLKYWTELLLSGAPVLLKAGRITPALVESMTAELRKVAESDQSVFFYTAVQATAEVL